MTVSFIIPTKISPVCLTFEQKQASFSRIKKLLKERNAVIIAHYYTDADIQQLAEESDGFVGDSLEMAKFGQKNSASTLVIAGVRFMGESAKILSPNKTVLMPTLEATCSLDLGCPASEFGQFCDQYPDRTVVVYANTSAAVKARADWVVTSSNALAIVDYLDSEGRKLIWAPDYNLGSFIAAKTKADMILWKGSCIVHEEFKLDAIKQLKQLYPEAGLLAHPESSAEVLKLADVVGSTSKLLVASQELPHQVFIVATDRGIFYKMQQLSPHKKFMEAPTKGNGATCVACAHCPWMAMNQLDNLEKSLMDITNEIQLSPEIIRKAQTPLQRMIHFQL